MYIVYWKNYKIKVLNNKKSYQFFTCTLKYDKIKKNKTKNMTKLQKWSLKEIYSKNKDEIKQIIATWNKDNFKEIVMSIVWNVDEKNAIEEMQNIIDLLDEEYINYLFQYSLEKYDSKHLWIVHILPALINTWKISEKWFKILNEFFEEIIEKSKNNNSLAYILHILVNTGKIEEKWIKLLNNFFSRITSFEDILYRELLIELINTGKIEEIRLNELFKLAIEKTESDKYWTMHIVPALIKTEKINKILITKLNKFFEKAVEIAHFNYKWATNIVPALIKTGKIQEKKLNEFFEIAIKIAENNSNWVVNAIPALINTGKIEEKKLNKFFEKAIKIAENNDDMAQYIVPALIKTGKIGENWIIKFNDFFEKLIENAKNDDDRLRYIVFVLINTGKIEEKKLNELFEKAIIEAENNDDWAEYIVPALINTGKIEEKKLNELFEKAIIEAENNDDWAEYIVPALINTGKIEEKKLNELFEKAIIEAENNDDWAEYIVPALINTGKIEEKKLNELFEKAIIEAENNVYWLGYILSALIKTGKIEETKLNELFKFAIEKAESHDYWTQYIVPALINTGKIKVFQKRDNIKIEKTKEKYAENYRLFNSILEKLWSKSIRFYKYLQTIFLQKEKLQNLSKFLDYGIDKKIFIDNFDEIIKISEKKSLEFWYFCGAVKNWDLDNRNNICEDFPINKSNFLDFMDDDEVLYEFKKDNWLEISWIRPWTKKWFLQDKKRFDYLHSEKIKSFEKFGSIIAIWVVEWSQNSTELKRFYKHIFDTINLKENRSSILQLWEVFNLLLKDWNYKIFDELLENSNIGTEFREFIEQNHISNKWRTILTLMIAREIKDSFAIFKNLEWKEEVDFSSIETLLKWVQNKLRLFKPEIDKYNNLPIKTSIWLEYEVSPYTAKGYSEQIWSDYKNDIEIISEYAEIAEWNDAVHEIATTPTDNPMLLILEMKLLADLDFLDPNFKKDYYNKWSRWIHISVWWEYGINLDNNANFIQNILMSWNLWSMNVGNIMTHDMTYYSSDEISQNRWENKNTTDIHLDILEDFDYIRDRGNDITPVFWENNTNAVEYRWLLIINWENFERLILSIFNLNMAKQVLDKYIINSSLLLPGISGWNTMWQFLDFIIYTKNSKEFINDERIYKMIINFLKLINDVKDIIENHNENFEIDETSMLENEQWLNELIRIFTSTSPIISFMKEINIDLYYLKTLYEKEENWEISLSDMWDFNKILIQDSKKIDKLTPRQQKLIYDFYRLRIRKNLKQLKNENKQIYDNIWEYLNWNIEETIRKMTNKKRFEEVVYAEKKDYSEYMKSIKIEPSYFYKEVKPWLINRFVKINNLFVKKDSTNALSMYDTTREYDWELVSDRRLAETTIFDKQEQWLKSRTGHYIIQWASDKMITQAIQKRILDFNRDVENIVL